MKGLADIDLKANKTVWDGGWGVNDDDMFDIAWEDFTRLSKSGQPFLQSIITLSTHAPDGIIPKACENLGQMVAQAVRRFVFGQGRRFLGQPPVNPLPARVPCAEQAGAGHDLEYGLEECGWSEIEFVNSQPNTYGVIRSITYKP